RAIVVECAAAFERPRAAHRRDAARRVHVGRAIAPTTEAVAEPEVSTLVLRDEPREFLDGLDRTAGDARGPLRGARAHMLFARAHRMGHHVDLRVDRIGAPDHHAIGFRHLARVGPGELAGAGDEAGPGRIDADGGVKAGIFLHVAKAVDAVAHDEAHRARIIIGPHSLTAMARFVFEEFLRD